MAGGLRWLRPRRRVSRPAAQEAPAGQPTIVAEDQEPLDTVGWTEPAPSDADPLLERLARFDRAYPRHRALDLGCGFGASTRRLASLYDRCDGLDASEPNLAAARNAQSGRDNCAFHRLAQSAPLPFDDETFDFVRCGALLPGQDRAETISEVLRVLRLLGVAVIELPHESTDDRSRLSVQITTPEGLVLAPGAETELPVTICNTGWSIISGTGIHELIAAAAWGDEPEPVAAAPMTGALMPGASAMILLPIRAPSAGGRRVLEVGLMQRCASSDPRFSPPAYLSVEVSGPREDSPIADRRPEPEPDALLTAELEAAGGILLDVRPRSELELVTVPSYLIARR